MSDGDLKFKVGPNPANQQATVFFDSDSHEELKLLVVDMHGRTVESLEGFYPKAGMNSLSFDVSIWSSGMYLIKASHGGKNGYAKLFVTDSK